jgi:Na+:H+ antiporter, NhaA family
VRRPGALLADFLRTENAGAKLLLIATLVALVWANSPIADAYDSLWSTSLPWDRIPDLHALVNDGLMTIFFLVMGLEIRRELDGGELSDPRAAMLPVIAALGGMIVPALIYAAFNTGAVGSSGWGIPTATDIAFAVAVVAIFGQRVPTGAKVFLLSLAIVDDIGAIVIIAVFYSSDIEIVWIAIATAAALLLAATNRRRPLPALAVWAMGMVMWASLLLSGIHPTIAGVVLAFVMPRSLGARSEDALHSLSSYVILPLFALANAGVSVALSEMTDAFTSSIGLGVVAGLVIGKPVGITAFSWAAVRLRLGRLPEATTWPTMIALASIAGIGFTVSIFVTDLAFDEPTLINEALLGVLGGSLVAAVLGSLLLHRATLERE